MAEVPAWLLPHTVTVEPYLGSGAHGDAYGPPVAVRCQVEEQRRQVRADDGAQITATATIRGRLSVADVVPPRSRVRLPDGRVASVLTVQRRDDGALGAWQHTEVTAG